MSMDVSKIWAGLDDSQRKAKWTERIDKKLLDWKLTLSSLSPQVQREMDLQLQPGFFLNFSPPLTPKDFDDLRLVLRMDAAFNHRTSSPDGLAQLTARLLSALSYDTRLAFATLQSLHFQLKSSPPLKTDALTLASFLSRDTPDLTSHLNAVGFDVVDLSDMISVFLPCAFALSFPAELTLRAIDVILLDPLGASFLFSIFYGVLRVNAKTIAQQSAESVFQFIADLPSSLTRQQVTDAFTFAYKNLRAKAEVVNAERKKRNWATAISRPGPIAFSPGVGDPSVVLLEVASGGSTAVSSAVGSERGTPEVGSPVMSGIEGDGSVTFDLKGLSSEKGSRASTAPPTPSTAGLLRSLGAAEKETDVNKLKELLRLALSHITSSATSPHLQDSARTSAASADISSLSSALHPSLSLPVPLPPAKIPTSSTVKWTELADYLPLPCPHMEGFLLKSRQASKFLGTKKKPGTPHHSTLSSGGLFGVTLHRRLFVLEGEFLAYFKARGEKAPSRGEALWMKMCWVEELSEKEYGQFGFGFEIRMRVKEKEGGKGKVGGNGAPSTEPLFVLFSNHLKERQVWVEVLKRATGQA